MLAGLLVLAANLGEYLSDHAEAVQLLDVLDLASQVLPREGLDLHQFFVRVGVVVDSATVRQSVVHCQFLLQVADLFLVALDCQSWIDTQVYSGLVADLHHALSELEGRDGLLDVQFLALNVGYHAGLAVATDGVTEVVGEHGLPVRNVVPLPV